MDISRIEACLKTLCRAMCAWVVVERQPLVPRTAERVVGVSIKEGRYQTCGDMCEILEGKKTDGQSDPTGSDSRAMHEAYLKIHPISESFMPFDRCIECFAEGSYTIRTPES